MLKEREKCVHEFDIYKYNTLASQNVGKSKEYTFIE